MESSAAPDEPAVPAKRPFAHDDQPIATIQADDQHLHPHPPASPRSMGSGHVTGPITLPNGVSRQASPALSSLSSLSSISSSTLAPAGFDGTTLSSQATPANHSSGPAASQPPAKRRKLTFAEKEQRRVDKEKKEREKADLKAKREEEKQVKDEERRQKNEIKEEKKREKDLEKQRKEEEKRKVEEEKEKKERAQKRISTFFAKPKSSPSAPNEDDKVPPSADDPSKSSTRSATPTSPETKSDYRRMFLPFALPSNTTWAATSIFSWDKEARLHLQETLDQGTSPNDANHRPEATLTETLQLFAVPSRARGVVFEPVREIIKRLTDSESNLGQLTSPHVENPLETLQKVPVRYIHFQEDVRPPYVGTYTKLDPKSLLRAGRNPFMTIRSDTNYDEDSEAEWEELDDDGEDLQSEGESELESNDGADEMDDFLDDEGADEHAAKKKAVPVDLEPICSGLCWEFPEGRSRDSGNNQVKTGHYKLALLQDSLKLPIDPFSSSYWLESETDAKSTSNMQPPRQPLQGRPNIFYNSISSPKPALDTKPAKATTQKQAQRLLAGSELEEFKEAVADSIHNKMGLLAILKKQFPKIPNTVLSDTLGTYAERRGQKEAEKRWKIKDDP